MTTTTELSPAGDTPAGDTPAAAVPHVVMVVGNPVQSDSRVRKAALTVAGFGARVTLVGLSPTEQWFEESLGPVRIINVPVTYVLDERRQDRRRAWRHVLVPVGYPTRDASTAALRRRTLAEREQKAAEGRARDEQTPAPVAAWLLGWRATNKVRRKVTYLRVRIQRLYTARGVAHTRVGALVAERAYQLPGLGRWRHLMPALGDLEMAFGAVLDELAPDVIHAHDVYVIGIAERAVARAAADGREVRWIYDAHEYVPGMSRYTRDRIVALSDLEREYIGRADAVITVSEPIARALQQRCALPTVPAVVLNAPPRTLPADTGENVLDPNRPSVRRAAGVDDATDLLVYSGNIDPDRGITTLVQSLAYLPDAHVVIVTNAGADNRYVASLLDVAAAAGAAHRLHLAPYVPGEQIVTYLSSATVGVHGLSHVPNHEMALPNKYFDYLHARLPVVVSDVAAMSELTRSLGVGEVYAAGDPQDLARAVRTVLVDRGRYAAPLAGDSPILRRFCWEGQVEVLAEVYRPLLRGDRATSAGGGRETPATSRESRPPARHLD
ncbi:MAG: glycosyltransferase family 4 protein [Actinomycetes bacterium]